MPQDTTPKPTTPITKVRQLTNDIEARLLDLNLAHEGEEHREAAAHFAAVCQLMQDLGTAMVLSRSIVVPQISTFKHSHN